MNTKILFIAAAVTLLMPSCVGAKAPVGSVEQEPTLAPESLLGKKLVVDERYRNFEVNVRDSDCTLKKDVLSDFRIAANDFHRDEFRFVSPELYYCNGSPHRPTCFRWSYTPQKSTATLSLLEADAGRRIELRFETPTTGKATVIHGCYFGTDTDSELVIKDVPFTLK